jgi:hypothetical protein
VVYIYLNILLLLYGQQLQSLHVKSVKYFWKEKSDFCRTAGAVAAYCVSGLTER